MRDSKYKTVHLPIEVPIGGYCWQGHTPCEYFDNEGGHGTCNLRFFIKAEGQFTGRYLKDPKCAALAEVDDV